MSARIWAKYNTGVLDGCGLITMTSKHHSLIEAVDDVVVNVIEDSKDRSRLDYIVAFYLEDALGNVTELGDIDVYNRSGYELSELVRHKLGVAMLLETARNADRMKAYLEFLAPWHR